MKNIEVAALAKNRDLVLSLLSEEGTVEIVPVDMSSSERNIDDESLLKKTIQLRNRITDALKQMDQRYPPDSSSMFTKRDKISREKYKDVLTDELEVEAALDQWEQGLKQETELKEMLGQMRGQQNLLSAWHDLPIDLSVKETEAVVVMYGVSSDASLLESLQTSLRDESPETTLISLKEDGANRLMAVLAKKTNAARVKVKLNAADFHLLPKLKYDGTPASIFDKLEQDINQLENRLLDNEKQLEMVSAERERMKILFDALGAREMRLRAAGQLGKTDSTVYFSGWIPEKKANQTKQRLIDKIDAAVTLRDPLEDEEYPVLLVNNRFNRAFESILTLFGAPSNKESDPLPAMAPFYMLTFGMMLSDVGYGLILSLGAAYLLFKVKVEDGLESMSRMLLLTGFASIFWGFLFGGFFGDLLTILSDGRVAFPTLWFNPMDAPINLLIYCMLFGVIHLFVGMAMKIINEYRFGNVWDGLWEVIPWYMIIIGLIILMAGATGFTGEGTTLTAIMSQAGKWMTISGGALVILGGIRKTKNPVKGFFSGLLGLYDITSWLSDILSYSRILALVLATSVIAVVFNSIAGMTLGLPMPLNYLVFALIAIPTHLLNVALSSLSAYVHAGRLQYIEMFGKFFDGGGRYYKPLKNKTKYINVLDTSASDLRDDDV